ncbi:TetR family transcriptional regulator [Aliihoeflea aestuarii]|uniref:TetR/AcrR family transcriptional regulator n=1 Tax=Aliihoeflea aestuarii TaxID=453840 RepID=UPI002093E005|nr:TetR/AcrR family transcriptional regulator [Aliihoeflea aestuarii]MCO6391900.1 TetR family transcriptional regulator [Aliihoeflea aestuarii]
MSPDVRERTVDSSRSAILEAAARCFHERGYAATSIDDVARALNSTKGRIYHHFESKADLFADVFRTGMEMNYAALEPLRKLDGPADRRWVLFARVHVNQMIATRAFQRVVWMGVEMHQTGAPTREQTSRYEDLIETRSRYGDIFRELISKARDEGRFHFPNLSIANQLMFMTLNSPIFWYSPRTGETRADIEDLIAQVVTCAWRGLGATEGLKNDA